MDARENDYHSDCLEDAARLDSTNLECQRFRRVAWMSQGQNTSRCCFIARQDEFQFRFRIDFQCRARHGQDRELCGMWDVRGACVWYSILSLSAVKSRHNQDIYHLPVRRTDARERATDRTRSPFVKFDFLF